MMNIVLNGLILMGFDDVLSMGFRRCRDGFVSQQGISIAAIRSGTPFISKYGLSVGSAPDPGESFLI